MQQQENSDIQEILRLVREIHVKVNEPSKIIYQNGFWS